MVNTNVLTLSRQSRLYLPQLVSEGDRQSSENRWHAIGPIRPWASYVVIETTVAGRPDSEGGYLVDIRTMDQLLVAACREVELTNPWPTAQCENPWQELRCYAEQVWHRLKVEYARMSSIQPPLLLSEMRWRFTPHLTVTLHEQADDHCHPSSPTLVSPMTNHRETTLETSCQNKSLLTSMTLQYEFAAAHRLHCASWSEARNRDVFGKCNHPSGHGHNYLLEVTVRWPATGLDQATTAANSSDNLPAIINPIVQNQVLQRLDHRFLNVDVAEFRDLNPTVENIAQVVFGWLDGSLPMSIELNAVKVHETEKTWAEVRRG